VFVQFTNRMIGCVYRDVTAEGILVVQKLECWSFKTNGVEISIQVHGSGFLVYFREREPAFSMISRHSSRVSSSGFLLFGMR
jgi:hypothetical protein